MDGAGASVVHALGGTLAFFSTIFLRPRIGLYSSIDANRGLGLALKPFRDYEGTLRRLQTDLATQANEFETLTGRKSNVLHNEMEVQRALDSFKLMFGIPNDDRNTVFLEALQTARAKQAKKKQKKQK
jgi:hypothetical protein